MVRVHLVKALDAAAGWPGLDGIGQRGSERPLEDIHDPAHDVDDAFRLTTVIKTDGRAISGLSPMPANVAELIGEENVPQLLEFLLQQRTASAGP